MASAAVVAASALLALCRPGAANAIVASPAGVATVERAARDEMPAYRGRMLECEFDDADALARARDVPPDVDECVIGVDHRDATRNERADQLGVLGGNVGDTHHEFLVLALRIVDERDRRPRDRRERRRLAAMVHPELDRGDTMMRAQ